MTNAKRSLLLAIRVLTLLAPFAWAAVLVGRYGVNVPYSDQWEGEYPLLAKMDAGTLGISDFFAQHNEHRIFFPRLIFYTLAWLTHWNVRAELWIILGLALIIAFNIWRLLRATGWNGSEIGFWLFFAVNILIFSPLHRENLLWGFQIGFYLPLACMTACLWVSRSEPVRARFAGSIALSVVCTFSVASGFTCWLLCLPLLIRAGGKGTWVRHGGWWLGWTAGFAASMLLYFHGYVRPHQHPAMWDVLKDPVLSMKYALTYLGLPFAFGTALDPFVVAQMTATAMLLVLAGTLGYLWRWRADAVLMTRCLPWLLLVAIALINATLTTIGRVGLGLWQALASRYVIFAIFLPIGLSFLSAAIYQHLQARIPKPVFAARVGVTFVSFASTLALLHLLGAFNIAPGWEEFSHSLLKSKALVETVNVVEEPELFIRYVYGMPLRHAINVLDKIGYLSPPMIKSKWIGEIADVTAPQTEDYGDLDRAGAGPDDGLRMTGWAVLPRKDRPADAVLLTCDDAAGKPMIFALAEVGGARTDVVEARKKPAYLHSGWQKIFKPGVPPPGAGVIKAWSFDAEEGRAYRLWGQADISE